jgi:hypothetical protein
MSKLFTCYGVDYFFNTSNSNLRGVKAILEAAVSRKTEVKSVTYDTTRKCVTILWEDKNWTIEDTVAQLDINRSMGESIQRVVKQDYNTDINFTGSELYLRESDNCKLIAELERVYA